MKLLLGAKKWYKMVTFAFEKVKFASARPNHGRPRLAGALRAPAPTKDLFDVCKDGPGAGASAPAPGPIFALPTTFWPKSSHHPIIPAAGRRAPGAL